MNRIEIEKLLKERNIPYEISEHIAVYHMEDIQRVSLPYPERQAKNLFLCDDKKTHYYLLVVKGDKKVDLKKIREENKTRRLSFASEEELLSILQLQKGEVTPFGLLNDSDNKVVLLIDEDFVKGNSLIGVHPNDNKATLWLQTKDLMLLLKEFEKKIAICSM